MVAKVQIFNELIQKFDYKLRGDKNCKQQAAGNKQASQEGRRNERAKGRWQQATGSKQQAGKPRRAKGRKDERAKG
ncbi:MAG: hypothetical protein LBL13_04590 [Bacteroidales bacterium]|nr:hypothetical protein [Bacteroidales bacterium]